MIEKERLGQLTASMSRELICQWLKVPDDPWPPDHYTLLGVPPAEKDPARIEQFVEQRMQTVRRYQLTNPEPATEALNLLARAFVCLSDPAARRAYDAGLFGSAEPVAEPEPDEAEAPEELLDAPEAAPARAPAEAAVAAPPRQRPALPGLFKDTPAPPNRGVDLRTLPVLPVEPVLLPSEPATPLPAPREKVDPAVESARGRSAQRGLGTQRALYQRLVRTRRLARAWEEAGKYLAWPKRRPGREDAPELAQLLGGLRAEMRGLSPLIGEAGKPGYLVAALVRHPEAVATFQALLTSQREALARDWWAGRPLLAEHREGGRRGARRVRKKGFAGRVARAVWWAVTDQPGRLLLLLALLAINVALWRTFCTPEAPPQTFVPPRAAPVR